jgi:hypothetical protein
MPSTGDLCLGRVQKVLTSGERRELADRVRRGFTADASKPNTRWWGDITCLPATGAPSPSRPVRTAAIDKQDINMIS